LIKGDLYGCEILKMGKTGKELPSKTESPNDWTSCRIVQGVSITESMGIHIKLPFLGTVLTTVLKKRGANWMHDQIGEVRKVSVIMML
jgi:hypothetical protein